MIKHFGTKVSVISSVPATTSLWSQPTKVGDRVVRGRGVCGGKGSVHMRQER